jgi:uncharacterized protein YndB with AHSA1/START domain
VNVEIDRVFDAPRDQVWEAWTDPEQVSQWWGPHHFHVPADSVQIDLRAGGHYRLTMVETGSGNRFPTHFDVVEVREAELLLMTSPPQPEFGMPEEITTRVEFSDAGDGTRVTVSSGPYTDQMAPNAQAGWEQQFEKLDSSVLAVAPDQR